MVQIFPQKGMALLTVLLLVVAITIMAGSMLASQKIMLREYMVLHDHDQMREYALAGEAFARQIIQQEAAISQTDSLQDNWAKPLPAYPVTDGSIQVKLQDATSRFNINNLYHDGKVDEMAVNFLQKLFISQQIDPNIVNAIVDWQDPDSDTRPNGGAEADFYQSSAQMQAGGVITNQPFQSLEELQQVRGMDTQKMAKLRPLLSAVPVYLPMNLNTMRPELLAVLVSMKNNTDPTVNSSPVMTWASVRANHAPLNSVGEFWQLPFNKSASNLPTPPATPTPNTSANASNTTSNIPSIDDINRLVDVKSLAFEDLVIVSVSGGVAGTGGEKTLYFTSSLLKTNPNAKNPAITAAQISQAANALGGATNAPALTVPQNRIQGLEVVAYHRQFLPYLPNGW